MHNLLYFGDGGKGDRAYIFTCYLISTLMTVSESIPIKVLRVVTFEEGNQDYRMRGSLVHFYLAFFMLERIILW